MNLPDHPVTVVVAGASGDLAKRKIFPAFFSLFCRNLLPRDFFVVGFARTAMSDDVFRSGLRSHLSCRYSPPSSCGRLMDEFLGRCFYVSGSYDSREAFLDLYQKLKKIEACVDACRIFYLAVPPSVFSAISHALAGSGLVACGRDVPWTRVVVEKPFGEDRRSSDELVRMLAAVFAEDQLYRIDHYLGKEVVQNLLVLRFANLIFEPVWNSKYVRCVHIDWREKAGAGGRAGYFDSYGIIRDVMQNHLLQILALTAMDEPGRMDADGIRAAKSSVLRSVAPALLGDTVLGQYQGYRQEAGVAPDSMTPTFAATVLHLNNDRWRGVPFLISAGKALNANLTEVRICFRPVAERRFCTATGCPEPNRIRIRVQPDEAIYVDIVTKRPGLEVSFDAKPMDLIYREAFKDVIPDAYERLLLDVIAGDRSLFISVDELSASWDVFTPLLDEIHDRALAPDLYERGGVGPASARMLAERHGVEWPG